MSTLKILYSEEGHSVLDRIHQASGINRKYLYQIATGLRTPSARIAKRMIAVDNRLSLEGLLLGADDISASKEGSHA